MLTKKQRLLVYQSILDAMPGLPYDIGLCQLFREVAQYYRMGYQIPTHYLTAYDFPEFIEQMPEGKLIVSYWWPYSKEGHKQRTEALQRAINLITSK